MGSKSSLSQSQSSLRQKRFLICILLVSLPLLLFLLCLMHKRVVSINNMVQVDPKPRPTWFDIIAKGVNDKNKIKVGVVNFDARVDGSVYEQLYALHPQVEAVSIDFDRVNENLKWEDFFPEWIDEDRKWGEPKCPEMPMPVLENYGDLNVVVAKVECGIRDVFRLQVNLVVANLAVESGWVNKMGNGHKQVYVVFIGSCGPMVEIFRCDDLLMHQGEFWLYNPDLRTLKQQMLMPVGSCQIAPGYAETGKEVWRTHMPQLSKSTKHNYTTRVPKLAYVTVLHSSEAYVCGAIALAQSIFQTKKHAFPTIRDLILLADKSIGPESIKGLKAAGWKIKRIERILSPFAEKTAYNRWNYSKLRIWQLTMYDKVIFIDSDLLVLNNIDHLFVYPQLSAAPNEYTIFNSGLMIIEPSQCMFETMMEKTNKVRSYNGGDQGFLNQIFTWWHRLPTKLNYLKVFHQSDSEKRHEVPDDVDVIHYLGLKPWMCYRDYDCNWDVQERQIFASDSAHKRWWQVYDAMPKQLQSYCGLTKKMNENIVKWRRRAKRNASFSDGHWKIEVKDPRRKHYHSD
ncbi:putative UDP-glucuronate:xylan alpha-glucuronosyltransferase 4 [Abrus precatorius]|uniref:Hexosyltransferase n=1 Tax=Abrus precatorius TaxID=3816 RepID=A0A8B8L053_ABRPR|nr:putative UDP-glucuronate:xylan alpha-glucuronosyltransferase 4 [Abrus precatorius]